MYPNGWNTSNWALPATRFLTPRVRYTYVDGGPATDDLGINDFDFSVAAAFPNFLYSSQPLYVVPSFSLHLWSGPRPPHGDLPANAYSAFLDFGWSTDPAKPLGAEVGVRLGVFTDFNTFNTHSGRIMGQGLFRLQATPDHDFAGWSDLHRSEQTEIVARIWRLVDTQSANPFRYLLPASQVVTAAYDSRQP